MPKQIELVQFPKINHLRVFVNEIKYRNSHLHKEYELSLVLRGEGEYVIKGKKYSFKKGDLFFVASHDVHAISSNQNQESENAEDYPILLIIQISNHFLLNYFPEIRTTVFDSVKLNDVLPIEKFNELVSLMLSAGSIYLNQKQYFQIPLVASVANIMNIVYAYVGHVIISESEKQKNKRKSDRLQRIISQIELNYANHIKLEDIANEENLSVTHFSHMFSSYFGITFQEYINLKRLENAIRLMKEEQKNLLEISYESGFSDPKYMTKMFIKKYNCTPKEYRRLHLNENMNPDLNVEVKEGELFFAANKAIEEIERYKKTL